MSRAQKAAARKARRRHDRAGITRAGRAGAGNTKTSRIVRKSDALSENRTVRGPQLALPVLESKNAARARKGDRPIVSMRFEPSTLALLDAACTRIGDERGGATWNRPTRTQLVEQAVVAWLKGEGPKWTAPPTAAVITQRSKRARGGY